MIWHIFMYTGEGRAIIFLCLGLLRGLNLTLDYLWLVNLVLLLEQERLNEPKPDRFRLD